MFFFSAKSFIYIFEGHYDAIRLLSRLFVKTFKGLNHRKEKIISLLSHLRSTLQKKDSWPFAPINGIIAAY